MKDPAWFYDSLISNHCNSYNMLRTRHKYQQLLILVYISNTCIFHIQDH